MDKLKMHSPNITEGYIAKLAELFPSCVTETQDDEGNLRQAIDFDQLRQELSESIVEGPQERYHLNWPGKREALLTANAPIAKTLRPCREESVDFDTTRNLFIEGDNLDALKLLQETYLGKVKMIYIDPPYNTGKDFIYSDDFSKSAQEYLRESGQVDEVSNRLVTNSDSNGRFHSDWLSMMYSRLKLSRNLLTEDGAIFISIDDNEVPNLRKLCDEIYGASNFIAEFVWRRRVPSAMADNNVSKDQDYVVCYQKGRLEGFRGVEKDFKRYTNPDNDPRGPWISDNLTVGMSASMRPNQAYDLIDPATGKVYPHNPNRVWAFIPESMDRMIKEGRIIFPEDTSKRPMQKRFQRELKSEHNPFSTLMLERVGMNTEATRLIQDVLGGNVFDYSKPLSLLMTLIPQVCGPEDMILDFFAGSSVTAHAVIQLNAEDGGSRRFIMVQLPEPCIENSEAYKAGFRTIADIGKERIRRAGVKIKESSATSAQCLDIGFRHFKVDSSNMANGYYAPEDFNQTELFVENIKEGRSAEDLLFQVILDWGLDLSVPISRESMSGNEVFFIDDNALAACFESDGKITEDFVMLLAERQPLRVVFRDSGFREDSVKLNTKHIFRLKSPHTDIKVI